jgi:hypothetical protein
MEGAALFLVDDDAHHRFPEASGFERRAQAAELSYLLGSAAAQTAPRGKLRRTCHQLG